jgi:hypothetical protein
MKRVVAVALGALAVTGGVMCGGSSGRETLPSAASGSSAGGSDDGGDEGGLDATVDTDATMGNSVYTDTFDVVIPYADRALPDVQAATPPAGGDAGMEAATSGPFACPPFIAVNYVPDTLDDAGRVLMEGGIQVVAPGGMPAPEDELPSDYGSDGGITFAAAGSVCATQPWFGTVAADQCLAKGRSTLPAAIMPPCSWAIEAGSPTQGAGAIAGKTRYQLCLELYQCMMSTECFMHEPPDTLGLGKPAVTECFCGRDDAGSPLAIGVCQVAPMGACLDQEMAALELPKAPGNYATALSEFTNVFPGVGAYQQSAWTARFLNFDVVNVINHCAPMVFDGGAPSGN